MKKKLVVVGNGMVTGRFLDELMSQSDCPLAITVISAESHGSYNRIMLSSVLAGEASIESIVQKSPKWFKQHGISLHQNEAVVQIDRAKKTLVTNKVREIDYDYLVFATGSSSATLPAQKACRLSNIFSFRSISDTENLIARAKQANNAVVIGGGFLGLEAAWGLLKQGLNVTLVHRSGHLLNRQLDETAGAMLLSTLQQQGLNFVLNDEVDFFAGEHQVEQIKLKSGRVLEADVAVVATGIKPNAEIAWDAGLSGNRGIKVDAEMRTDDPSISAIGECIEFEGATYGLVDPLWRQAKVLAARLCRADIEPITFEDSPIATKLKISGVALYSAGQVTDQDGDDEIVLEDAKANVYRKLILRDGVIVGIVLYGDVSSGAHYFELMQTKQPVSHLLPALMFGEEYLAA